MQCYDCEREAVVLQQRILTHYTGDDIEDDVCWQPVCEEYKSDSTDPDSVEITDECQCPECVDMRENHGQTRQQLRDAIALSFTMTFRKEKL